MSAAAFENRQHCDFQVISLESIQSYFSVTFEQEDEYEKDNFRDLCFCNDVWPCISRRCDLVKRNAFGQRDECTGYRKKKASRRSNTDKARSKICCSQDEARY